MKEEKVGVIYDPRMLEHKSKRKHPEKPGRIRAAVEKLNEEYLLQHPRVEYMEEVRKEVEDGDLALVHKEKYIKHVVNLWPKTSHRTSITILDSYFNQQSEKCARLAVGGVLQGIEKVMSGDWRAGFAIVRPPGHHSGARNTINGFCVYNNVAIGARHLTHHYGAKRVAIVDWDVHHGDGTQHIFQESKDVLLISMHRYDRGTFYPASEEGYVTNVGEGEGKGFSVNISLDFVDEKFKEYSFQSPGDNDYIYIYHRIVQPILQAFNPDFILVSSGFDAARGDPLGGFTLTPNGYYYLTKRLLELKKPMLVVLEGGYSLHSIGASACGVMKALVGDQSFPEQIDVAEKQMKKLCCLHKIIHAQIDNIIEVLSEYWPCLDSEQLKHYTQMIKNNEEKQFGQVNHESSSSSSSEEEENYSVEKKRGKDNSASPQKVKKKGQKKKQEEEEKDTSVTNQFYFAAGHMQRFKNFSPHNPQIYKWAHIQQMQFYQNMKVERQFTPKYYGKEGSYIILENLLFQQHQPVVIDVKVSRQSGNPTLSEEKREKEKKKEEKSTSGQYGFRISGYTTPNYKQGGLLAKDEELVKKILSLAVDKENKDYFCSFLQEMSQSLKGIKRKYFGTSIVIIKGEKKSSIRWVDFHYWIENTEESDHVLIEGISNLRKFIKDLQI